MEEQGAGHSTGISLYTKIFAAVCQIDLTRTASEVAAMGDSRARGRLAWRVGEVYYRERYSINS